MKLIPNKVHRILEIFYVINPLNLIEYGARVAQMAKKVSNLLGPVLFPSVLLSYFRKWPKSAVLGSQMAPSGNGPVTGGFQPKNDFFGPRSVLTPLTALETPTNLWKHLAKCQYLT